MRRRNFSNEDKNMSDRSKEKPRAIILDAAKAIYEAQTGGEKGPKPEKHVIEFRTEHKRGVQRDVVLVPTELLKFRKDNSRYLGLLQLI